MYYSKKSLVSTNQKAEHHQKAPRPMAELSLLCCDLIDLVFPLEHLESALIQGFLHSASIQTLRNMEFMGHGIGGNLSLCSQTMVTHIWL